MKSSIKAFALIVVLALVAVSCNSVEKILPKKDGLWEIASLQVKSYLNDSLLSDQTVTDSLGTMMFASDGTGYDADYAGNNRSDFTWAVNDDNNVLTITDSTGISDADILESSKDAMTLFTSTTSGVAPLVAKLESTLIINRVK